MTLTISPAGTPAKPAAPRDPVRDALLDSRLRWRDLVGAAADLAFETDEHGRFSFLWPEVALGWLTATLIGEQSSGLLHDFGAATTFNPFQPSTPIRGRRGWLLLPNGAAICLAFSAAPIVDARGRVVGSRGIAQDITEQDNWDAAAAAKLRRAEVLDQILARMRQEVMAPRMMEAALSELREAVTAEAVAVIDVFGDDLPSGLLHQAGLMPPTVLALVGTLFNPGLDPSTAAASAPVVGIAACGRDVLACLGQTRFGEQAALVLCREAGARPWDRDDVTLVSSTTGIVRVILEHEAIQREMAMQARTDPLTGLLNRRAFLDEMSRRTDRLDREELPGTLMFVDIDHFKRLNDGCGHEAGDQALCVVAGMLRNGVRPTDLVARLGGDEFALWLDSADEMASAERAEALRLNSMAQLAHTRQPDGTTLSLSIGIATRWPKRGEDIETLMHRADQAMYEVKRGGRGHWKVAQAEAW